MTQRIIHRLEAVEVDHQEGTTCPPFGGIGYGVAKRLVEHQPVGQRGERVKPREIGDLLGGFALGGDIRTDSAETGVAAGLVEDRGAR